MNSQTVLLSGVLRGPRGGGISSFIPFCRIIVLEKELREHLWFLLWEDKLFR